MQNFLRQRVTDAGDGTTCAAIDEAVIDAGVDAEARRDRRARSRGALAARAGEAGRARDELGDRRREVLEVRLDAPFIDAVADGMLAGKAGPAPGALPGLPFSVHHHLLSQVGVHHIENARLAEMARDKVYTSCTMVLPTLERGAAGASVRPVAIGVGQAR